MTDREAFEVATKDERVLLRKYEGQPDSPYAYESVEFAWQMWQAAVKAENEACAKVCDEVSQTFCAHAVGDAIARRSTAICAAAVRARS